MLRHASYWGRGSVAFVTAKARRVGLACGIVGPLALLVLLASVTVVDRRFLADAGWSAISRTDVAWPSILTLGPHGVLVQVCFVVTGLLGVGSALALAIVVPPGSAKVGVMLLGLMSVAVCFMAFRPDAPGAVGAPSWHDHIHNGVYPLIPFSALVGSALSAASLAHVAGWKGFSRVSLVVLALVVIAIGSSFVGAVAQLARYVLLASMIAWSEGFALAGRRATSDSARSQLLST